MESVPLSSVRINELVFRFERSFNWVKPITIQWTGAVRNFVVNIPYSSEYTSAIHLRLHLLKIFATITDQSASVNYTVCYMTSIDEKFIELWHSNTPVDTTVI